MTGLISNIAAKSALQQFGQPKGQPGKPVTGGLPNGRFAANSGVFFAASSGFKSENAIVGALDEGLGKAKSTVSAARAGAGALSAILDKAEAVAAKVAKGVPGQGYRSTMEGLKEDAARAIQSGAFGGTNLLAEGSTLTVTLGFNAGGTQGDFRQLNFTAVGLAPSEAAAETRVVTTRVIETVSTPITREERITARLEKLADRQVRLENREERIGQRLEKLTEREERLTGRLERLEARETRVLDRIVEGGGRPTDPKDARELEQAFKFLGQAREHEAQGRDNAAKAAFDRAQKTAEKAGVTISLEKLERLENRLDRIEQRTERVATRIEKVAERKGFLTERLTTVDERQKVVATRIERLSTRLEGMSEKQRTAVVGYRTETIERDVEVEVPAEGAREKSGGFTDLMDRVGRKLAAGDAEGAFALIGEARERLARVDEQLDRISGALDRRSGHFGDVAAKLGEHVRSKVEKLDEDSALRAAAEALSELSRFGSLFGGEARPGILALFEGRRDGEAKPADTARKAEPSKDA